MNRYTISIFAFAIFFNCGVKQNPISWNPFNPSYSHTPEQLIANGFGFHEGYCTKLSKDFENITLLYELEGDLDCNINRITNDSNSLGSGRFFIRTKDPNSFLVDSLVKYDAYRICGNLSQDSSVVIGHYYNQMLFTADYISESEVFVVIIRNPILDKLYIENLKKRYESTLE